MSNEDIQRTGSQRSLLVLRMLTDPGQMEELMAKLLNNAGDPGQRKTLKPKKKSPGETSRKLNGAEAAAKEAEDLHKREHLTATCDVFC